MGAAEWNRQPPPASLSTQMRPPCTSTMWLAMVRGFHAGLDELRDADAANFELEAVGIHLGEHEQVFGEARKAARVLDDNSEKALAILRIVHGAGKQRFRETLNGGERGAEFVRNVGDEI